MDSGNGEGGQFSIIAEKTVPDAYSDSVTFEVMLWGITMEFGKAQKPAQRARTPLPHIPRFRVHMSPQHAKALAVVLAKNVRGYEEKFGTIALPKELYKEWEVDGDQ